MRTEILTRLLSSDRTLDTCLGSSRNNSEHIKYIEFVSSFFFPSYNIYTYTTRIMCSFVDAFKWFSAIQQDIEVETVSGNILCIVYNALFLIRVTQYYAYYTSATPLTNNNHYPIARFDVINNRMIEIVFFPCFPGAPLIHAGCYTVFGHVTHIGYPHDSPVWSLIAAPLRYSFGMWTMCGVYILIELIFPFTRYNNYYIYPPTIMRKNIKP